MIKKGGKNILEENLTINTKNIFETNNKLPEGKEVINNQLLNTKNFMNTTNKPGIKIMDDTYLTFFRADNYILTTCIKDEPFKSTIPIFEYKETRDINSYED